MDEYTWSKQKHNLLVNNYEHRSLNELFRILKRSKTRTTILNEVYNIVRGSGGTHGDAIKVMRDKLVDSGYKTHTVNKTMQWFKHGSRW